MNKIDKLIINSPYTEPTHYWIYKREMKGQQPTTYLIILEFRSLSVTSEFKSSERLSINSETYLPKAFNDFSDAPLAPTGSKNSDESRFGQILWIFQFFFEL